MGDWREAIGTRRSVLLWLLLCVPGWTTRAADLPNIVFILADDMGYGDVRYQNRASRIPTPNLDRLAREGTAFSDAHTPSGVCTPTRYGVMTGRYCWRSRLRRGVLGGYSAPLIERSQTTVAEVLQSRGYRTGIVGKWHLGIGWKKAGEKGRVDFGAPISDGPTSHGFDFFYGIAASLDMPPYVYIENDSVFEKPGDEPQKAQIFPSFIRAGPRAPGFRAVDSLDYLTEKALGLIARHTGKEAPFFLYFPLTAPHKPVLPHPRFEGKSKLGLYGDFILQVDSTVGRVLDAIDESGVADDTLVIFTSDNGSFMYRLADTKDHVDDPSVQGYRPEHHRPNRDYRGTKTDIWEGGHRVPFVARWPGKVAAGKTSSTTICLTDFTATCAEIVGAKLADGVAQDSYSFLPDLLGKPRKTSRPPVIHHSAGGLFAIRSGKWKLVLGNGSGGRQKPRGKPFAKPYLLFDLESDPSETKDLASAHPDVVRELVRTFEAIRSAKSS